MDLYPSLTIIRVLDLIMKKITLEVVSMITICLEMVLALDMTIILILNIILALYIIMVLVVLSEMVLVLYSIIKKITLEVVSMITICLEVNLSEMVLDITIILILNIILAQGIILDTRRIRYIRNQYIYIFEYILFRLLQYFS